MSGRSPLRGISSRLDYSIHRYHESRSCGGLHAWDPRVKLMLLVTIVGLNTIVAHLWLSLFLFSLSVSMVVWSRIPIRSFALFFLPPAWATLIVLLGFSIGFGITPLITWGPLTVYREGLQQGISASARVSSDIAWMAAILLSTPFGKVLDALQWFRLPLVLIDTIGLAYRYAFALIEKYLGMRDASMTRGGFRSYKRSIGTVSMILAQLILRAYDRAVRIQTSMAARGADTRKPPVTTRFDLVSTPCPNRCDVTPDSIDPFMPVLSCRNISFSFYEKAAISDISIAVSKGEVVVLCGPNGSGKSTLLRLFSGILTPDQGEVILCGSALDRRNRNEAFRYVGILFQDPNDQLFCTHVKEDIAYGPRNLGLPEGQVIRLVETAMNLMEVSHLAERPIHMLSHGEMKRVGLAGLIAMRPPLILLDEPTASLDPASARQIVRLIRHLNEHHGYTFIIVTHDVNLASLIARRILVLNEGKIIADGSPRKILADEGLLESCRLEPPILTRLFQRINERQSMEDQIPITIEEAADMLNKRFSMPSVLRKWVKG